MRRINLTALPISLILVSLLLLLFVLLGTGVGLKVSQKTARASAPIYATSVIDRQFDETSCVLAAIATAMNYSQPGPLRSSHTSEDLAVLYRAVYGSNDWSKSGQTSHQAQELVKWFGFPIPVYGKLSGARQLEDLARAQKFPVVFRAGYPQHALVALAYFPDTGEIAYGDPYDGQIHTASTASDLFNSLEPQKWFMLVGQPAPAAPGQT